MLKLRFVKCSYSYLYVKTRNCKAVHRRSHTFETFLGREETRMTKERGADGMRLVHINRRG